MYKTKKTKARTEKVCKKCDGKICPGEEYLWVDYDDGFWKRGFGAFHEKCF